MEIYVPKNVVHQIIAKENVELLLMTQQTRG